jgi:hypothetical protein
MALDSAPGPATETRPHVPPAGSRSLRPVETAGR